MALVARDVMIKGVLGVPPSMTLNELEDALTSRRITGAPVIDGKRLVGIVSRSDIVRYFSLQRAMAQVLAEGKQAGSKHQQNRDTVSERIDEMSRLAVRDIMVTDPVTVPPDATIEEVARAMVKNHVHRVLVMEGDGVLGLISSLDLAQLVANTRLHE